MNRNQKIIAVFLALCLCFTLTYILLDMGGDKAVETLSKYGSRSDEVRRIQTKLKELGLYTAAVDGIFGIKTQDAVKKFQSQKGLKVDGIVGPQTLKALGLTSDGSGSGNDLNLLARIISAEGRGEPFEGQVAIGAVILNRVEHPSFPDSIAGVIYQKGAFDALTDGQFNEPVADSAFKAARAAMNGQDPVGGAIYYYNPATATNKWIRSRPIVKTIGKHVFCK